MELAGLEPATSWGAIQAANRTARATVLAEAAISGGLETELLGVEMACMLKVGGWDADHDAAVLELSGFLSGDSRVWVSVGMRLTTAPISEMPPATAIAATKPSVNASGDA